MSSSPRLVIIGLDCAEPSLVFDRFRANLPNLSRLIAGGSFGKLESCIPAITVPAWSCMTSGRDPGELGIYGFRNRRDRNYGTMAIADGRAVSYPRLWEILGENGWKVAAISVPGTYPPQIVNGVLVSCFLTPNTDAQFTHPPGLGTQLAAWLNPYRFDVPNFRSDDKGRILKDIYHLCNQTFTLALHLLEERKPDLLMLVEMGVDRLHHAFWKHMDSRHPLHVSNSPYADAICDYYCHVDRCIGKLLDRCEEDTAVLVVSDHGAQPLMGGLALNEWLIREGYLTLKTVPSTPKPLDLNNVDWSQTKAWGAGGYYGRVFLNVQGREPQGVIPLANYREEREVLARKLAAIPAPDGSPLGAIAYTPQELYRRVRGIAPDLIVYLQNLAWRSLGSVGMEALYSLENDTGPDDANHAQHGLFIFYDPRHPQHGQQIEDAQIYDILPSLLSRYAIAPPDRLRGKILAW